MNKDIKTFEEWKQERALREATNSGILLIVVLLMGLIAVLASCSSSHSIAHTPSKREIRKAMRYSTSEYAMPDVKNNTGAVNKSKYCFHPGK